MRKRKKVFLAGCIITTMLFYLMGCGQEEKMAVAGEETGGQIPEEITVEETNISKENSEITEKENMLVESNSGTKKAGESKEVAETERRGEHVDTKDFKFSEGLEFKSNGDGTCTLAGIGVCTDADLVIPEKGPNEDIVTLIDEYAFFTLENVDSVTLVNYDYEIDKYAFQYGEFTTLRVIGGNPVFSQSAFSSCEDLVSISFRDCNIKADEYSFFSCGKDAELEFFNCTGYIDEYAFQYGDFVKLSINNCELEIEKSAFSSCEELTSLIFTDSTIKADEYAFFGCGDSAVLEMTNCSVILDDRAFQYSSLDTLTIAGSDVEVGESTFSGCENLSVVNIDCKSVILEDNAFFGCEDMLNVSVCDNADTDNDIKIGDRAFQYCKRLECVMIGEGDIAIGECAFSGGASGLVISVAGNTYTEDSIKNEAVNNLVSLEK